MPRADKDLYHHFVRFEGAQHDALLLNNILTELELDRIRVHYSFLSTFTHCLYSALDTVEGNYKQSPFVTKLNDLQPFDHIISELVLSYCLKMLEYNIEMLKTHKFRGCSLDRLDELQTFLDKVRKEMSHFWFIYESPTQFDIELNRHRAERFPLLGKQVPETIEFYYPDPLRRLQMLHGR